MPAANHDPVLHRAYNWARSRPLQADGLLGAALLACSAGQFAQMPAGVAAAALAVNVTLGAAVALRRRYTVTAFCMGAVVGAAQAVLGFQPGNGPPVRPLQPTVTDAALVVLLYSLAAYRPRRVSVAGLVLCLAGSAAAVSRWTYGQRSVTVFLLAVAALAATFLAAWVLGDSAGYRRAYYVSLEERLSAAERTRDLETKRASAVEQSAVRLRRIERDLHDGAQVRLTMLAMTLGEIKELLSRDPGAALPLVNEAHQAAKDTLAELRDLARGIHPAVLDRGLEVALRNLADSSAVPAALATDLTLQPSPAIESIVYFSAAELLANAAKHSGASHVTVALRDKRHGILLTVTDDGTGGARITEGGGLAGLRDRVLTVDGHLSLDSPPGGPTAVTIELPGHA